MMHQPKFILYSFHSCIRMLIQFDYIFFLGNLKYSDDQNSLEQALLRWEGHATKVKGYEI